MSRLGRQAGKLSGARSRKPSIAEPVARLEEFAGRASRRKPESGLVNAAARGAASAPSCIHLVPFVLGPELCLVNCDLHPHRVELTDEEFLCHAPGAWHGETPEDCFNLAVREHGIDHVLVQLPESLVSQDGVEPAL